MRPVCACAASAAIHAASVRFPPPRGARALAGGPPPLLAAAAFLQAAHVAGKPRFSPLSTFFFLLLSFLSAEEKSLNCQLPELPTLSPPPCPSSSRAPFLPVGSEARARGEGDTIQYAPFLKQYIRFFFNSLKSPGARSPPPSPPLPLSPEWRTLASRALHSCGVVRARNVYKI